MKITHAEFSTSTSCSGVLPSPPLPLFAFIGRSNVGKSSLINFLLQRKGLAKTSSKPGKTRLINYFLVNRSWYVVDLPGYGWAQVSKEEKGRWGSMVKDFLRCHPLLLNTFLLIDARLPPQDSDLAFARWLGISQVPCAIVFTKADKLGAASRQVGAFQQALRRDWARLPLFFLSSVPKKKGREELLRYMGGLLSNLSCTSREGGMASNYLE